MDNPTPTTFELGEADQAILSAPVIFVDGAVGAIGDEHIVHFNLFQNRFIGPVPDGQPPVHLTIAARIVMSRSTFKNFAEWAVRTAEGIGIDIDRNITTKE